MFRSKCNHAYSSLALSSETLPTLAPFLGLQATNSTSKIKVALQLPNMSITKKHCHSHTP